jgi:hypothetical protein
MAPPGSIATRAPRDLPRLRRKAEAGLQGRAVRGSSRYRGETAVRASGLLGTVYQPRCVSEISACLAGGNPCYWRRLTFESSLRLTGALALSCGGSPVRLAAGQASCPVLGGATRCTARARGAAPGRRPRRGSRARPRAAWEATERCVGDVGSRAATVVAGGRRGEAGDRHPAARTPAESGVRCARIRPGRAETGPRTPSAPWGGRAPRARRHGRAGWAAEVRAEGPMELAAAVRRVRGWRAAMARACDDTAPGRAPAGLSHPTRRASGAADGRCSAGYRASAAVLSAPREESDGGHRAVCSTSVGATARGLWGAGTAIAPRVAGATQGRVVVRSVPIRGPAPVCGSSRRSAARG